MLIARSHQQQRLGSNIGSPVPEGFPLGVHQFADTLGTVFHDGIQLFLGESPAFTGALQFNELALLIHDKVHIHLGVAVFLIAQVQAGFVVNHARADGRHLMNDGADGKLLLLDQPRRRAGQCHHGAGDGRRTGTAVRFQHVAVQSDRPLTQGLQVHSLAECPADQPLDFHAPAVLFDAVPLFPFRSGCRQHGILGCHPALAFSLQEGRYRFLHAGGADHPGIARSNQAAAVSRAYKICFNADRPLLVRCSSVKSHIILRVFSLFMIQNSIMPVRFSCSGWF